MTAPPSCFAALPVGRSPAIEALQGRLAPELRRIHPADLHLTIAYFGRIDPAMHGALLRMLGALPFTGAVAVLDAILPLPRRDHPSAITLSLAHDAAYDTIVALMTEHRPPLLERAGRPPEEREPLPHVTIARPRGRRMTDERRAAILTWCDTQESFGQPIAVGAPVLMRSRPPGGLGPHYEIIEPPERA